MSFKINGLLIVNAIVTCIYNIMIQDQIDH